MPIKKRRPDFQENEALNNGQSLQEYHQYKHELTHIYMECPRQRETWLFWVAIVHIAQALAEKYSVLEENCRFQACHA